MCKKSLSLLLALVMCLALVPVTAFAADYQKTEYNGRQYQLFDTGMSWTDAQEYCKNLGGHLVTITNQAEQTFVEGLIAKGAKNYYWLGGYCESDRIFKWITGEQMDFTAWANNEPLNYGGKQDKIIMYRVASPHNSGTTLNRWDDIEVEGWVTGYEFYSENSFGFICEWENIASGWAQDTLQKANDMGLIPDSLKGADLTKPITRKEFAAVAVKTYENLTGKTTTPAAKNPFTDTNDTEVLKAYNVGITSGTAADKFSPDVLLNREQAATMLTRVLKASYIPGWMGATDANFTLNFTQPAKFADDDKISDWAKPSVYFMAANGIISGTGNNMFSPRAVTTAEQAANYASATREQALVIAVRMIENLKGKSLDYKERTATPAVDLTLADAKANAQAAGHEVDINYAWMSSTGYPKTVGGFSLIYKKDHKYDNVLVLEFVNAADATAYGARRLEDVSRAVIRTYDKFYLEALMNDKSVSFTDDMAKQVMKDLFKTEGTAA